jgi:hypothetical protein
VSEFLSALPAAFRDLAALDPGLKRFGAAHHRYALAPTIDRPDLPDELRAYAATVAGGGAGPYYGILPLARVQPIAAPAGEHGWTRALPIAHLGCGYTAVMPLDDAGIWIVAPPLGIVERMYSMLTAYFVDWIDRLAHARWPEAFVPPGQCALATALSGYLGVHEQRLGVPAGSLAGADLRAALDDLGPGAIAIAGSPPLFEPGEPVDPCVSCARLVENLGLRPDVVTPGVAPIPER